LPTAIARFYREMEAIGKLHHPNIVQAFDAGEVNGQSYIVMELLEGIDLSNYVKQHGTMEISEALSVVRQTALGLQHAHNTGLIHRDIKPSNLWLLPDKTVKVLDLGLARLLESDHSESVTGQIVGSRGYISPEQAQGTTVDQRSDIYSLGCTFYFLLTGQTPPENGDFVLPVAVLEKMIAFDPQNRFQSMSEVIAALDHLERKPNRFYRIILFLLLTATALSAGILLRFIFDARRTETPESETSDMVVPTVVQTIDQKNDQKNDQIIDPKNSADGNWLTTKEIADYLSVSDATIYRWIEQKGLPAHRAGRGWRFNKNEVNLWLKNQNKEKNAP
jgi:excisionase family DNA binding protein